MKIDIKLMVIIALTFVLIGTILFRSKPEVNDYKDERDKLELQIDSILNEKQKIDDRIIILEDEYTNIVDNNYVLVVQNDSLAFIISNQKSKYKKSKKKIKDLSTQLNYIKSNPVNRTGDSLINSLINKFN